ncbi:monooxygenase [Marmoricola endophyticus]|uniref:L-lysine N6-monooxygenase MbtG n=1 Tax=Marmoricola endophyticus TaxID=2040280 RepID=A0A917BEX0_9ACTN|nr:SidA/IucD/PvdA family monooxygenase [Marmoricola endophyticus]GGF35419.1 monooxygenase [Marmoricola endophyticus]
MRGAYDDGTVHDLVGIGLGPFNLGLACLADPLDDVDAVFLEAEDDFAWHPGMLLPDAVLQVPFLADLVSLADPTSPYSFLAWLKETGRLYPFYIRESFYPLRREYDAYCRWAAHRVEGVRFDRRVRSVEHDGEHYVVRSRDAAGASYVHRGRRVVLGVGTPAYVPDVARDVLADKQVVHSGDYLAHREDLLRQESVTVVGSGQSAAEVFRDLLRERGTSGALTWLTRSPRFFPLEYTKLTLEMTSPEYSHYFRGLPAEVRDPLLRSQQGLYKGISGDVVDDVFDTLYALDDTSRTRLLTGMEVTAVRREDAPGTGYVIDADHAESGEALRMRTDALVLATGYRPQVPDLLEPVRDRIRWDEQGRFDADEHYAVDHTGGEIFVQNAEAHTHGFVAPDLGMGAHRSSVILAQVTGRTPYPVEQRIAVQEFGVPTDLRRDEA